MANDNNRATGDAEEQLGFDADDFTDSDAPPPRREPVFSGFDDEEDYEEPDRDTNHASRYLDDNIHEETAEPDEIEAIDDLEQHDELELDWGEEDAPAEMETAPEAREQQWQADDEDDDEYAREEEVTRAYSEANETGTTEEDNPPWEEDDYDGEYAEDSPKWPMGLVAVGLLAVVLLAAGGYGVLQQRAATEEEIRQLRAELATVAAPPAQVEIDNSAVNEARKRNIELSMAMESLRLENSRLVDTVAGLEAQLEAQQKALAKPAPPPPRPQPAATKPKPAATATSTQDSSAAGDWFVNFGSYSQRATADSWAAKLKPANGRAVVTTGTRDGKTFYRVRVIGLSDKAVAERVAGELSSQYGLGKLWVGK